MKRRRGRQEAGFALVAALWAVALVSVVALGVVAASQTDARLARGRRTIAEAGAVADAALNIAVLRLAQPLAAVRPPTDGTPFTVGFVGHPVQVRVQDEAGKIDLNATTGETLRRLLVANGLDGQGAQALVDKILDWREPGAGKRLNGAKAEEYRLAGMAHGPREGPFSSVDELKLVLGMDRALFDRLCPALTVHSQSSDVDPEVAPLEVLLALPGVDEAKAAEILGARAARRGADAAPASSPRLIDSVGHVFMITAEVQGPDLLRVARTAVVRLTGHSSDPVWIYRWD